MQRIGDLMVARKERVARPFDYRAEGGDDHKMAWIHVDVVQPPRVDSLAITSASAGLHRLARSAGRTANRRLARHRRRDGRPIEQAARRRPRCIRPAVRHFRPAFRRRIEFHDSASSRPVRANRRRWSIDRSGPYWFELHDREGLIGGESDRWDIQAIVDQPPSVSFNQPAGNLLVTPAATRDNQSRRERRSRAAFRRAGLHALRSHRLGRGRDVAAAVCRPRAICRLPPRRCSPARRQADSRTFDFAWQLGPLNLKPGTNLLLTATATDYASQKTTSSPRRISIITPEEFEDHLAARESVILNELARLLKLEQSSRLETAGSGNTAWQSWPAGEGRSRSASRRRVEPAAGAPRIGQPGGRGSRVGRRAVARTGQQPYRQSGIAAAHARHRRWPGAARSERASVGRAIAHRRAQGRGRHARVGSRFRPPPASRSPTPAGCKTSIAAALEAMLGDLAEWNSFRGLARQLAQIRRDQADLEKSTKEIGAATLTNDIHDLSPQQQADLKKLGDRQVDLARQLDKVMQRMEQVGGQLAKTEPLSAESLSDALDIARRQSPGGQMRDAAEHVAQNRIGQALGQEASAGAVLDEMLDILGQPPRSGIVAPRRQASRSRAAARQPAKGTRRFAQAAQGDWPPQSGDRKPARPSGKPSSSDWPGNSTILQAAGRASGPSTAAASGTARGRRHGASRQRDGSCRPVGGKGRSPPRPTAMPRPRKKISTTPSGNWPKRVARPRPIWPNSSLPDWKMR